MGREELLDECIEWGLRDRGMEEKRKGKTFDERGGREGKRGYLKVKSCLVMEK